MIPRIGTAGWSIPRAVTADFPGDGAHLHRYARVLSCAEINTTFYKPPLARSWLRWAASVPPGFQFSVKAPKAITHEKKLICTQADLQPFLTSACTLGDALGPILFQLPPSLDFDKSIATSFFKLLRQTYIGAVVLEPRHPSWFTPPAVSLLATHNIVRVTADPPRVPDLPIAPDQPGLRYWRLHGSPRMYYSPYAEDYLRTLADFLRPGDWIIFDNTASGAALADALRLRHLVAA